MLGCSVDDERKSGSTTGMAKKAAKWTKNPPATDDDRA